MRWMTVSAALALLLAQAAPASAQFRVDDLPSWTFEDAELFLAPHSVSRSEDGLMLADGTIVVSDQTNGMTAIAPDGSMRPFGRFAEAGYVHAPPENPAGPNGVTLEPDGVHALVADIFTGAIYRVNLETEETARIYQHSYGVNVAIRDSSGAIWFIQSTQNVAGPDTEARIFETMDTYAVDGALFRLPPPDADGRRGTPRMVVDGLAFPNGMVIDEDSGRLYLNETTAHRVSAWRIDIARGDVSAPQVIAEIPTPDNLEMDGQGRLWVGSPIGGRMIVLDPDSGETHPVFWNKTEANDRIVAELLRLWETREPSMALVTPEAWAPMPGGVTGVIFDPDGGTVYLTGLGDALLKLDRPE